MPLIVGQQIGEVTTTTITAAATHAKVFGMPWEVWLIVLAVVLPFLFAVGVSIALYVWARGKMQLDRYLKVFKNGDVKLGDMKANISALDIADEKHVLKKGKPKVFLVSRFGWRQPLHFFEQGISLEQELTSDKTHKGTDLENSEYLKAYTNTERAKQIFALSLNLGFSVILGIACASVGVLIGLAIAHFSQSPATGATAANITTTTIAGMVKH